MKKKTTIDDVEDIINPFDMYDKHFVKINEQKENLCVVRDMINLICFTILSILFNKWWLIFFSILFMTHWEKSKK